MCVRVCVSVRARVCTPVLCITLMTSAWTGLSGHMCVGVCACEAGRMCESAHAGVCVCVTSVMGCRCLAHSSASDLVEIWDQRGRSAC